MKSKNKDAKKLCAIYTNLIHEMAYGMAVGAVPMNQDEFINKVKEAEKKGARPISITMITIPTKKSLYGPIYKVSRVNGFIGTDYEAAVNRQLGREGKPTEFQASKAVWGEHESKAIIDKEGRKYLMFTVRDSLSPIFVIKDKGQFRTIPKDEIVNFLPKTPPSQPGLEKGVMVRKPALDNIVGGKIEGIEFIRNDVSDDHKAILAVANIQEAKPEAGNAEG